ncbi:MAG: hypothetical protein V3U76_12745 [Granulosicoccus sp.]
MNLLNSGKTIASAETEDTFRDSTAACARTLADDAGMANLDPSIDLMSDCRANRSRIRGQADALALRNAHHDADTHAYQLPAAGSARHWFSLLERLRYESLGARQYRGVAENLDTLRGVPAQGEALLQQSAVERISCALEQTARKRFLQETVVSGVDSSGALQIGTVGTLLPADVAQALDQMACLLNDQGLYAEHALRLIGRLAHVLKNLRGDGQVDAGESDAADDSAMATGDASNDEEHAACLVNETVNDDTDDTRSADNKDNDEAVVAGEAHAVVPESLSENAHDEAPRSGVDSVLVATPSLPPYKIFTTDFDQTKAATELADTAALVRWRAELDRHIEWQGRLVVRLASRLQRVLLARQSRQWHFDQDEGQLDARRLTRVLTSPATPLAFKVESDVAMRDTVITLLIDNSRSMLGRPIMIAAATADILARTLERCGVRVEILGFTTVELHGGQSTARWEQAGRPAQPGRLNDLRHIIYKTADAPWRSARRNLGLMLDKEILKQNIDGEALLWAHRRLLCRSEQRRILMVISDGAPVETSTLAINPLDTLTRHLQSVIDDIEQRSAVELLAIGIGHDVSRYYKRAMNVYDARELGPAMLSQLDGLFRQTI